MLARTCGIVLRRLPLLQTRAFSISRIAQEQIQTNSAVLQHVRPILVEPNTSLSAPLATPSQVINPQNTVATFRWVQATHGGLKNALILRPCSFMEKLSDVSSSFSFTQQIPAASAHLTPPAAPLVTEVPAIPVPEAPTMLAIKRKYQPSVIRRKRKHGFLKRLKTRGGRKLIARRIKKGRHRISV